MPPHIDQCPHCRYPLYGGVNPALIMEAAKIGTEVIGSVGKEVQRGVTTQHEFNKDNYRLAQERAKNESDYLRHLSHTRYHDPESLPPRLRLSYFGIDPPRAMKDKKNAAKLLKADDALYAYAVEQIEKQQRGIKGGYLRNDNSGIEFVELDYFD